MDNLSDFIRDAQEAEQAETAECPECGHSNCYFFGYCFNTASFECRKCKYEFTINLTTRKEVK